MAFIKTEEVKNIRNQLKKEFPNIKFSVTRLNYSKVKIVLLSGDVDFYSDYYKEAERDYLTVNHNYIKDSFTGTSQEVLKRVSEIAHSQNYYDNSDAMTDYFDTAYYVSISVADWKRAYQLKEKAA